MTIAYRHIVKELGLVLIAVFVVLMIVSIGARFTGYMQEAAAGKFSADLLWTLMILRLPEFVQLALPFSLVLAIILSFGRLHADQEYVVLTMGGTSPQKMILWISSVIVPAALIVGFFSLIITPTSRQMFVQLLADTAVTNEFDAIVAGEFRSLSNGNRTVFVEGVDRDNRILHGVFLYENNPAPSIALANSATFLLDDDSGKRFLQLQDGVRYEGLYGNNPHLVMSFSELSILLDIEEDLSIPLEVEAMDTLALERSDAVQLQEFDWRVSLPLMTLISGLIAFGISRTRPRSGRYGQVVPGLFTFLGYYLLLVMVQQTTTDSAFASTLLIYGAHAVLFGLAVFLVRHQNRPQ